MIFGHFFILVIFPLTFPLKPKNLPTWEGVELERKQNVIVVIVVTVVTVVTAVTVVIVVILVIVIVTEIKSDLTH